jgi:hypothetical protein
LGLDLTIPPVQFSGATSKSFTAVNYSHEKLADEFTTEGNKIGHRENRLAIAESYNPVVGGWTSVVTGTSDVTRTESYYSLPAVVQHSDWQLLENRAVLVGSFTGSMTLPSVAIPNLPGGVSTATGTTAVVSDSTVLLYNLEGGGYFNVPHGTLTRNETYTLSYANEFTDAMLVTKMLRDYVIAKAGATAVPWPDFDLDVSAFAKNGSLLAASPVNFWDGRPFYYAELVGRRNSQNPVQGSLSTVSGQGSTYRLHTARSGPARFRWIEVFSPYFYGPQGQVTTGPDESVLREEAVIGGPTGAISREYVVDPPASFGGTSVITLRDGVSVRTPSMSPSPGAPRLYLKKAIFSGEAAQIDFTGVDLGRTTTAIVRATGDAASVRIVAVELSIVADQGMAAALAQGVVITPGTDLIAESHQILAGGWQLVVVGLTFGTANVTLEITNSGVTYGLGTAITVYPPVGLAVDANRDGTIAQDTTDATNAMAPFRFWLNDDDDGNALNNEQEVYGGTAKDYELRGDFGIASKRDLEDFARLCVYTQGMSDAFRNGDLQLGLRWKADTVTGAPAINIYRHFETDGGTGYLTDNAIAIQQTTPPYSTTLVDATGKNIVSAANGVFVFKQEVFAGLSDSQPKTHLLFEGAGIGKGMLQIVILDRNGAQIGDGPGVWLDLVSLKSTYQRVKVTPRDPSGIPAPFTSATTFDANGSGTEPSDDGYPFVAPADEGKTALVFVHGSNIPYGEALWNAETMFKRLYWQGYRGRFVLFYWDTLVGPFDGEIPAHYNLNEYRALKYGWPLKNYVEGALPLDYAHNVIGHSMGNAVIASALRAREAVNGSVIPGMTARNVVFLEAAVPASSFDSGAATLAELAAKETPQTTPDGIGQLGYRGMVETGVNATLFNVYNVNDYALGWWVTNQRLMKPEDLLYRGYARKYTWTTTGGGQLFDWSNISAGPIRMRYLDDISESMAFVARSRTTAAGRKLVGGSISNNFNVGAGSIELAEPFGDTRADHSGAFTRRIQQLDPLYRYIFERARQP